MITTTSLRLINISLIFGICGLAAVMLTGCVSQPRMSALPTPSYDASPDLADDAPVDLRKGQEEEAWARIGSLSRTHCGITGQPARQTAVAQSSCVTDLVYDQVLPVAMFPRLVKQSRAEAHKIAQAYAAGQISPAQYQAKSQARLRAYKSRWAMLAAQKKVGFVQTVYSHTRKPVAQLPPEPVRTARK